MRPGWWPDQITPRTPCIDSGCTPGVGSGIALTIDREVARRPARAHTDRGAVRPKAASVLISAAVFALLGVLFATPAQATFSGTNGRIAFSQGDLVPVIGGEQGDLSIHSQVFTINPNGRGLKQLTHVAAGRSAGSPDWSPDGERIVYESNQSGDFHIWVMNANGSGKTQLTHESGFEDFQPSWSPDGNKILFSHCGEPFGPGFIVYCDINVMNANGTGVKTLLGSGHWSNVRPNYSPDGRRITFSSDRGGLASAVWVMKANGSRLERLTRPKLRAFWPDWAPGGHRILFSDNCCLPHSNLWTVRPDGSGTKKLTHVPQGVDAAFGSYSPDGQRIVTFFTRGCSNSPCRHFSTLRSNGSHFHRVVTRKANTFLTDWGPGG
jgi:dipeptidyl aminopeptidase/acylaminoacyl peptidase